MASFQCPPGFQVEETMGKLCLEDIDEDSELWLIRMPADIELSDLDKKKIFLDQVFHSIVTESEKVIECFTDSREIPNLYAVLPQRSDGKLHEVKKKFQGSILITEGLSIENPPIIKSEIIDDAIDHSVNDFLNSTAPKKSKKSKKKKSKFRDEDVNDTEETEYIDVSQEIFQSKAKKSPKSKVKSEPMFSDNEFASCSSQARL